MGRHRISRREFLYTGAAAAAGTVLAACQPQTIVIETEKEVTKIVTEEKVVKETVVVEKEKEVTKVVEKEKVIEKEVEKIVTATPVPPENEAPALSRMVEAGQIPPLEERIPSNPFVIEGLDGIGNFGGIWRLGKRGQADGTAASQVTNRSLLKIDQDLKWNNYLCESYEISPDAKAWTFHLRKGVKWHDGNPATSEDWRFWWDDIVLNTEYTPAIGTAWVSFVEGERVPLTLETPDAFTVVFKFAMPKALLYYTGGIRGGYGAVPRHFLEQFHPTYADAATLEKAVADAKLDSWTQLMGQKNNRQTTQERPYVEPWIEVNNWSDELVWFDRNPYFWEIDTAGNQLPYIDRLQFRDFSDLQIQLMWIVNGEIDCQARHSASNWANYTVLKENEAKGDYKMQLWRATRIECIHFNQTTKNQRLRELFSERDFRIAISHACNRDEMRDLLMDGNATNKQYCPPSDSPYYYEPLANAYLEYDVDKANDLLDGLGYTEKDSEGYRLFKDGSGDRISMTALGQGTEASATLLMLMDYFKAVGLQLNFRGMDRALLIETHQSNEVEMTAGQADRNLIPIADPQVWIKHTNIDDRPWCNAWTAWYMNPDNPIAEKPPDGHWIWDIWGAWEEIQQTADQAKQIELFHGILKIWSEELPSVGLYGDLPLPIPVKNDLKGIHAGYGWDCCSTDYEHIIDNATWYWLNPEQHA